MEEDDYLEASTVTALSTQHFDREHLVEALAGCFFPSDGWLEYGVVEHRLRIAEPELFAELVERQGHRMVGSRQPLASTTISNALKSLRSRGVLHHYRGRSTGSGWTAEITFWGTDPGRPHTEVTTWGDLRRQLGRDGWCDADRVGLTQTRRRNHTPRASAPLQVAPSPLPALDLRPELPHQEPIVGPVDEPMHPVYLPFSKEQVLEHFVPSATSGNANPNWLKKFSGSIDRQATGVDTSLSPLLQKKQAVLARQIEKDETFWTAASLMAVTRSAESKVAWTKILSRCLGQTPPVEGYDTWADALGSARRLYFEVPLPSPAAYQVALSKRLTTSVLTPTLRRLGAASGSHLEGLTKVDAVLVCDTGVSVAFEAKVESDISTHVTYDTQRNQLARTIDVLLDAPKLDGTGSSSYGFLSRRDPAKSCVVLLTPAQFKAEPTSRLYGWLMSKYVKGDLLGQHLSHREQEGIDWVQLGRRLGWLTFEDVRDIIPGSCQWLSSIESTT